MSSKRQEVTVNKSRETLVASNLMYPCSSLTDNHEHVEENQKVCKLCVLCGHSNAQLDAYICQMVYGKVCSQE